MTQLSLLPDKDPAPPKRPTEPIVRSALIEGRYRFWLKRAWGGGPMIAWIGLNPSIANATRDDPTMLREMGFSFRWGYGSLVKLNVYPLISSSPAVMKRWRVGPAAEFHETWEKNVAWVAAELGRAELIMAAWGEGADRDDLATFISAVDKARGQPTDWQCLAFTASGAPRHTLARGTHHIPDDAKPRPWRS